MEKQNQKDYEKCRENKLRSLKNDTFLPILKMRFLQSEIYLNKNTNQRPSKPEIPQRKANLQNSLPRKSVGKQ